MFFFFLCYSLQQHRYMLQMNIRRSTPAPAQKPICPQWLNQSKKSYSLGQQKSSGMPLLISLNRQNRLGLALGGTGHQLEHFSKFSNSPIVENSACSGPVRLARMHSSVVRAPEVILILGYLDVMMAWSRESQVVRSRAQVQLMQQVFNDWLQILLAYIITEFVEVQQSPSKKAPGRNVSPIATPMKITMKIMTIIWKAQIILAFSLQMPQTPSADPTMMARLTVSMIQSTVFLMLTSPRKMLELMNPQMVVASMPTPINSKSNAPITVNHFINGFMMYPKIYIIQPFID